MNAPAGWDPLAFRLNRRALVTGAVGGTLALLAGDGQPVAAAATNLYRGPTGAKRVAITIDCGSDRGYAESILNTLATRGVKCSFGMTGEWAQANPDLLRRMVNEGHHLMNHTNTHPSFTGLSTPGTGGQTAAQRKWQIESANQIVINLTGVSMKPWFRAPYGDIDSALPAQLGEWGYSYNAMWTVDLLGWKALTQDQIVSRVAANHGNGYIYLMHVGAASQEGPALPRIITTLQNLGYSLATLPGLLAGGGTTPPPPPPAAKFVAGDTVKVTAGLYLRTGPGTGYGVVTTMPTGTTCTVVSGPTAANGYSWYKLTTPYGTGWAAGEFLQKTSITPPPTPPPPTPPPAGQFVAGDKVKVTAGLYLRTGPGTGYGVITTMPTGTVCTVVSGPTAANGHSWYKLTTPYGTGWASGAYLQKTSTTPPPPTPPPSGGLTAGQTVQVTAGLYLRTGPGFNTTVITTMPTGTRCTVVAGPTPSNNLTWYQLDTPYGRGWAAGEYLKAV
jgi:peptidoglycan/xylan/chitin deacetylase (PgdA/CDA1 family)/uncharacterized protein YraI